MSIPSRKGKHLEATSLDLYFLFYHLIYFFSKPLILILMYTPSPLQSGCRNEIKLRRKKT